MAEMVGARTDQQRRLGPLGSGEGATHASSVSLTFISDLVVMWYVSARPGGGLAVVAV
jgi:hypothetical protein